jgi:2-polyprenyl-3-methyl-5-hydroxy-6-metoxy-1,4-benzoquinol methylase
VREMENYKSFGDIGEIWFGESCQRRVINWFVNHVSFHSRMLDIGCGNGSLLLQLVYTIIIIMTLYIHLLVNSLN